MRIGLVCSYSFDAPGGVQNHIRDLAELFLAQGHEVSALAPADDSTPLPGYLTSVGRTMPVRYNGSVARLNFGPVTNARVSKWLENGDFDIVHIHEPAVPGAAVLALMAHSGPMVATFHSSLVRSRAMQAAYPLLRPSFEKVAGRIAVSEDARRTVTTHLGGDAVVIPNGVYVDRFAAAVARPEWQGTAARPTMAFLGRMHEPRKGLPVLAEALPAILAAYPGLRLLVAGPGDQDEIRAALPAGTREAVEFLGAVSDEDKARLFASCDVYVAPNTGGESFGIILIEAMAAGAPVLASDLPAFARVLDGGRTGRMFRNEDPADLARQAISLLGDPDERRRLEQVGRERAAIFDWSVVGADIMAVYETVLDGARMGQGTPPQTRLTRMIRSVGRLT